MNVVEVAARLGGVVCAAELRTAGISRRSLEAALRTGAVERVRVGWFALPGLTADERAASRLGGRLACASVAAAHGLWLLHTPALHVEIARHDGRRREREPGLVLHWGQALRSADDRTTQPMDVALASLLDCVSPIDALCAVDSALNRRLTSLARLRCVASASASRVLEQADPSAESGTETVFRLRARAAGMTFASQVPLPGGLRADFLFGARLVVEVDGVAHHAGAAEFASDRARDAWLAAIGYRVVRFSYDQVVHRWHEVESTLRLLLAQGEHLRPARR